MHVAAFVKATISRIVEKFWRSFDDATYYLLNKHVVINP